MLITESILLYQVHELSSNIFQKVSNLSVTVGIAGAAVNCTICGWLWLWFDHGIVFGTLFVQFKCEFGGCSIDCLGRCAGSYTEFSVHPVFSVEADTHGGLGNCIPCIVLVIIEFTLRLGLVILVVRAVDGLGKLKLLIDEKFAI